MDRLTDQQAYFPIEMQFYISAMFVGFPDEIHEEKSSFLGSGPVGDDDLWHHHIGELSLYPSVYKHRRNVESHLYRKVCLLVRPSVHVKI